MEHAQRLRKKKSIMHRFYVLILILMEHAQRFGIDAKLSSDTPDVLILILMEHAQRFTDLTLWNYLQSMS